MLFWLANLLTAYKDGRHENSLILVLKYFEDIKTTGLTQEICRKFGILCAAEEGSLILQGSLREAALLSDR